MKLWLISQNENNDYDTYDSAVVAAETEEEARNTHPYEGNKVFWLRSEEEREYREYYWASRQESVEVRLIGEAVEGTAAGVICSSFNAG